MRLASVILDIPTQSLDAPYTYAVPDEEAPDLDEWSDEACAGGACADAACAGAPDGAAVPDAALGEGTSLGGRQASSAGALAVEVGCAVLVPFGHRRVVGFVVSIAECGAPGGPEWPRGLDPSKVKTIARAVSRPYFDEEGAACAQWLSERYVAPLSSCVRLFTPPGGVPRMVRSREGFWHLEEPAVGEVDDRWVVPGPAFGSFEPRKNAVKQASIMEAVRSGAVRAVELSTEFGAVSGAVRALEKKGVVRVEHRRRLRGVPDSRGTEARPGAPVPPLPELTAGQRAAVEEIERARAAGRGEVVLVDGVTGSGKTEVYLRAIEQVLASGRTACVLVPEISLTPQTVGRFRGRFGDTVAVMHSRMSAGERYDQWDFIRSGEARVVVGARSALFTPLRNVGIYVIDEEHEGSYKQDSAPRYHARDVAVWMARRSGAVVVLGSATPSIESLYRCAKDSRWHQVSLPERANGRPMPEVRVIDMAREFSGGSRSMFSQALTQALAEELGAGRKAVLLLNQRGFAKFLLCRECGFVPTCPSCDTSLTYHERGNFLICHHCGHREPAPARCPSCGSPYLKKFGAGTQRVEADLRVLLDSLPGVGQRVPIIRMDADTTRGKGAHQRLLEQFAVADAAVLLGTQMIAKGLDFDDVTLVGVINADTQLELPDYRAHERTFDLVEQVAGRAGRANLPGRVLVQTYEADAAPIRAAASYDRALFLRAELPKRRMLGYPPYVRMANVLLWGTDEAAVSSAARAMQAALEEAVSSFGGSGWTVLPAVPCVMAKLRGTYRWHVVVKCPPEDDPSRVLLPLFRARKPDRAVNAAVDVEPEDLL